MTDQDPLEGADIGETVTLTETSEIWLGEIESDASFGSDRLSERRLDDVELVTNEHGDKHLQITVESEVTKTLPRRWDYSQEPRTEREEVQARRNRWKRYAKNALPILGALVLSGAIAVRITNSLAGEIVVNGEPLPPVAPVQMVLVFLIVILVTFGIQYLPRGLGGRP